MANDDFAQVRLADPLLDRTICSWSVLHQVPAASTPGSQMSVYEIIGYCLSAFGIGYAGGAIRRIARQAVESLD